MGNKATYEQNNQHGKYGKNKKKSRAQASGKEQLEDVPQTDDTESIAISSAKKLRNNTSGSTRQEGTLFEDFEQVLPDEILFSIFLRCNTYTLSVVAPKVCKQFYNNTLPNGYLWQQKCKFKNRRLLSGRMQQKNRTFKYIYMTQSKLYIYI